LQGVIQNLQKFGPSQRGPPKIISTLAIPRHGGPLINLFVILTLLVLVTRAEVPQNQLLHFYRASAYSTRDTDAMLSVRLSVRHVPLFYKNGLNCQFLSFFTTRIS